MPPSTDPTQSSDSTNYFNNAFMDIESYLDFPPDSKSASGAASIQDLFQQSPQLTPTASPSLGPHYRASPVWSMRDSPGPNGYQPFGSTLLGMNPMQPSIAPLQISNSAIGQPSPPDSSGSSPDKYARGDISPLDSLISHIPSDIGSRTVHGQVTPPDDFSKSPHMAHLPTSLVLPMRLISPEGSPTLSSRSKSPGLSSARIMSGNSGGGREDKKRRRSSTGQSSRRQPRKSVSADENPDVQEAKRRRFLERNRVAASKCRQKKKAWMQDLESDARDAQNMSKQLKSCVGVLKEEILQLKNELLKHNTCECSPIRQYLSNEAMRLADGALGRGTMSSSGPASTRTSKASDFSSYKADNSDCHVHEDFDLELIDGTDAV